MEGIFSIILGNLMRLAKEEVIPVPLELFEDRHHSRSGKLHANPYLFLHDVQSVWLDLEVLDLLKNVTQEKR